MRISWGLMRESKNRATYPVLKNRAPVRRTIALVLYLFADKSLNDSRHHQLHVFHLPRGPEFRHQFLHARRVAPQNEDLKALVLPQMVMDLYMDDLLELVLDSRHHILDVLCMYQQKYGVQPPFQALLLLEVGSSCSLSRASRSPMFSKTLMIAMLEAKDT
jgi:hypothetical protein